MSTPLLLVQPESPQAGPAVSSAPSAAAVASISGRQILVAVRVLVVMTVILGILYPAVVLGLGQLIAPAKANGSMISAVNGQTVGSSLIGQQLDGPEWFAGRPSAAGEGYDAMSSSGSNLAADSQDLVDLIKARRSDIASANGVDPSAVPADAVTASASGLDPDISPEYALLQVNRVATARGLTVAQVTDLVHSHTEGLFLGFIGSERVNVLQLNIALDALAAGG